LQSKQNENAILQQRKTVKKHFDKEKNYMKNYDVIIIGAGPSGIFCAY